MSFNLFVTLSVFLILVLKVILPARGAVNDEDSLEFKVVPPDQVTFVLGKEDTACIKGVKIHSKSEALKCEVNREANVTWQTCYSFNEDTLSKENFLSCAGLFRNEKKYCKVIKQKRNSNYAVVTMGELVGNATEEPHTGCFRCIAQVGNQKKVAAGRYKYLDQCGTPTRYEAIKPLKDCHRKNDFLCMSKERECRVLPPEDVRVIQTLTADGKVDLILHWKEPKTINYVAGVYGYTIIFKDDIGGYHCNRLITKYNKTMWFKNGTYRYSITENIGYKSYKERKPYRFKLQALPFSNIIKKTVKLNFRELCEKYTEKYKYTPTPCHMVTHIKLVSCIPGTSATLMWNNTGLPSNVNNIRIWYFPIGRRERYYLSPNTTSYTFVNASNGSSVFIQLKVGEEYTYSSREIKLICKHESIVPDEQYDYTHVVLIALFSVCSLIIIIILVVYRIDKCTLYPFRVHYYNQFSTSSTVSTSEQQQAIKVMLVYPEGCTEVEYLIVFLGNLLRGLGVDVSVDLFENKEVAEYGRTNKLVKDFNAANYIVVLCVDSQDKKDNDFVHSKNYEFVTQSLLLPTYREENGKRFIAVSLSRCGKTCTDSIPAYLKDRSYALSSDLEFFVQHIIHGSQTTCSSTIFREACREKLKNIDDMKRKLQDIDKAIRAETHQRCYPGYCSKGIKEGISPTSSTMSLMEDDESRNSIASSIDICPEEDFAGNKSDKEYEYELVSNTI